MKENHPKYLACIALLVYALAASAQTRMKYNFNPGWKVFAGDLSGAEAPGFNDAFWKAVTLPYSWNEDAAFKVSIEELPTGIAWYRKHFKLPAAAKGQKIFLEFEGIRQAGEFYLNGKYIGRHENGVAAFGFDISGLAKTGNEENVIAARIDNSWEYKEKATQTKFQWIDKNFNANYGGINKNVFLHITGKLYQTLPLYSTLGTTGIYIYAKDFDIAGGSAVIHISAGVKNEFDADKTFSGKAVIKDMDGKVVGSIEGEKLVLHPGETTTIDLSSKIAGLHFWSWGYGYLYNVETMLLVDNKPVDRLITKTGFRKTGFKDGMIYLNDRVIQVHGYAQRTTNEWPAIGSAVPAWMSDYSNRLMVEGKANLVRWMHIMPWKQDVESCDRLGLMEAMPAGDAERDITGRRWEQRKELMRDAIIYNRNNPSIVFYECGNESISEDHMREMKAIRDQYDPHGGRAIGSREMLDSRVAEYGGEMLYINKSAHIPMWAMEYSRDEGLRKYWDEYSPPYHKDGGGPLHKGQDASVYNRNQDSHAIENVVRWYDYWHERPGTGKRVSAGGVNIVFSESNTHHRGAENYRRSGEVDALRIKKDNYYANQVMWNGWVDIEHPGMHIIGHWNYAPGTVKDVYVVSSAEKVELRLNGKSLGFGEQSSRFLFTFKDIRWQPGTISAVGYGAVGKQVITAAITTAGAPAAIRLKAITGPKGLQANGQDLALVEAEVIDARGNRCPTALSLLNFTVEGPAEWRGGMAQGPDNYILSKQLPVECGVNRVLIRAKTTRGKVTVKANAAGLKSAAITLTAAPVAMENGLSKQMPADGLPAYLKHGPTPQTPSYRVTRNAIAIINAVAGANTDSAFKSFDDNELSDWYNDGKLSTAWIEYELEQEATVNEVALKLNNFRSRSYPIRILVDGKTVFADSTQRGLGYFTAICKPVRGRKVKIELMQPGNSREENTMKEVSGKKLDDGVSHDDSNTKGRLSIIEAEIYENATGDLSW
jgi:hypothetical protein